MKRLGILGMLCALTSPVGAQGFLLPQVPIQFRVTVSDSAAAARDMAAWKMQYAVVYGPMWRAWLPIWTMGDWADSLRSKSWSSDVQTDTLQVMQAEASGPPSTPWGITRIGAQTFWDAGITGAGVKVGIIDGGIDSDNPYLPNVAGGYTFGQTEIVGGDPADPASWEDDIPSCNGHGTHVAGTVGGQDGIGVAPGVQLYALKVMEDLNGGCSAWTSSSMAAMLWARDNGLTVLNASLGGPSNAGSQGIIIADNADLGIILVSSIGNTASQVFYPGADANAVGVGSVSTNDNRSSFSGQGPQLDIMAPGQNITSTLPGGGLGSKSGTSMASPHVMGVAALFKQVRPAMTTTDFLTALAMTATDKGAAGRDNSYGNGVIEAWAAWQWLVAHPVVPRVPLLVSDTTMTLSRTGTPVFGSVWDSVQVTSVVDTWRVRSVGPQPVGVNIGRHPSGWVTASFSPAVALPSLVQFQIALYWPR